MNYLEIQLRRQIPLQRARRMRRSRRSCHPRHPLLIRATDRAGMVLRGHLLLLLLGGGVRRQGVGVGFLEEIVVAGILRALSHLCYLIV